MKVIVKPQGDLKLAGRMLLLGVGLGRVRVSDQGSGWGVNGHSRVSGGVPNVFIFRDSKINAITYFLSRCPGQF